MVVQPLDEEEGLHPHVRVGIHGAPDVHFGLRQEGVDPVFQVDLEAALDLPGDRAGHRLVLVEGDAQVLPEQLLVGLLLGDDHFPAAALLGEEDHVDRIAAIGQLRKLDLGDLALGLQPHVHVHVVVTDLDHDAGEHLPFLDLGEGLDVLFLQAMLDLRLRAFFRF